MSMRSRLSQSKSWDRKWTNLIFRKCTLQKRYYLLCVLLGLAIASIFLFYQIGFKTVAHTQRVKMCFPNDNPMTCYLSISTIPCNNITKDIALADEIILFEDILEAERKPTPDRSIFFIETSCVKNGLATLSARQACAIESAARWNPERDVFVLFASQVGFFQNMLPIIMESLRSYQNIHFRRLNFHNYSVGTPAEEFLSKDTIFKSSYLVPTFSDLLRIITLYHFGGIYFDLDTVIQKNLDILPANFAGREISTFIGNGVLGFSNKGLGHQIVELIIKDVCANFNPKIWGDTGPQAVTRMLKSICNVTRVTDMRPEICWGFNVLPEQVFYPIYGTQWERFFDPTLTKESLKTSNQSVAVHFWNTYSIWQPILKDFKNQTLIKKYRGRITTNAKIQNPFGETAYGVIAKMNCPKAYASSGDLF